MYLMLNELNQPYFSQTSRGNEVYTPTLPASASAAALWYNSWWRKADLNQIWLWDEGLKDIAVLQIS